LPDNRSLLPYNRSLLHYDRSLLPYLSALTLCALANALLPTPCLRFSRCLPRSLSNCLFPSSYPLACFLSLLLSPSPYPPRSLSPSCLFVSSGMRREEHVRTKGQRRYGITNEVATHLFADNIVTAAPGFNAGTGRHIRAQQAFDWSLPPPPPSPLHTRTALRMVMFSVHSACLCWKCRGGGDDGSRRRVQRQQRDLCRSDGTDRHRQTQTDTTCAARSWRLPTGIASALLLPEACARACGRWWELPARHGRRHGRGGILN
jgi:hypothetical protein